MDETKKTEQLLKHHTTTNTVFTPQVTHLQLKTITQQIFINIHTEECSSAEQVVR